MLSTDERSFTFRVYLPEASRVELVGSFTAWRTRAIRMEREDTGWWSVTVEVPVGDHDFSYLVDDSVWMADYAASGVKRNPFGGWVSQIHVPAVVEVRRAERVREAAVAAVATVVQSGTRGRVAAAA